MPGNAQYHGLTTPDASSMRVHTPNHDHIVSVRSVLNCRASGRIYDEELAMVFERHVTGGRKDFKALLTGRADTAGGSVHRILRTPRCYVDASGQQPISSLDEVEKMNELLDDEFDQWARMDYEDKAYGDLIARAIARRVQLACGLPTRMFVTPDRRHICMTIKPDDNDLCVEAARLDYRLQVSNRPFDARAHEAKLATIVSQSTGENTDKMNDSKEHLRSSRRQYQGSNPDEPEMDPLLSRDTQHAELASALERWGHTEQADGIQSDVERLSQRPKEGQLKRFWDSIVSVPYDPTTYFAPYASYRTERTLQPYYRRYPLKWRAQKEETMFAPKDRIRLTASLIRRHINVDELYVAGLLDSYLFALHDEDAVSDLRQRWSQRWLMVHQPLNDMRFYFGEKIALYFAWLGFYTKMLLVPTIVGMITLLWQHWGDGCGFDRPSSLQSSGHKKKHKVKTMDDAHCALKLYSLYVGVVIVWSTLFSSLWRRQNAVLNLLWGTYNVVSTKSVRPQFRGKRSVNAVTDDDEVIHATSRAVRLAQAAVSALAVLTMIVVVLSIQFLLFLLKTELTQPKMAGHYFPVAITSHLERMFLFLPDTTRRTALPGFVSVINALQIIGASCVFAKIAKNLNAWMNHRTEREDEWAMVVMTFCFEFVNSFAPLFFVAFIKRASDCEDRSCVVELNQTLLIILGTRIAVGNALELGRWRFRPCWKRHRSGEKAESVETRDDVINKEILRKPYDDAEFFQDYNEMVIQYGYVTLFFSACPLAPLLALLNNIVQAHVGAHKLCELHRRPFPGQASSIGAWRIILRCITYASFATNVGMLFYTSQWLPAQARIARTGPLKHVKLSTGLRAATMMSVALACIFVGVLMEQLLREPPNALQQLKMRFNYIAARVFNGLHVVDESRLHEQTEPLNLSIEGLEEVTATDAAVGRRNVVLYIDNGVEGRRDGRIAGLV